MSHFVLYNEWEKINPEIRDLGSEGIETVLGLLSQSSGEVILSPDLGFALDQPLFQVLGLEQGTRPGPCSRRAYILMPESDDKLLGEWCR